VATKTPPTRADFDRLAAEFARLRTEVDALRARFRQQAEELKTQFTRIAQMQATLDEQRIADTPIKFSIDTPTVASNCSSTNERIALTLAPFREGESPTPRHVALRNHPERQERADTSGSGRCSVDM
jgi:septal ring factor EnvC (AmiA/AmiB activator)